jgi:hypothetical protein
MLPRNIPISMMCKPASPSLSNASTMSGDFAQLSAMCHRQNSRAEKPDELHDRGSAPATNDFPSNGDYPRKFVSQNWRSAVRGKRRVSLRDPVDCCRAVLHEGAASDKLYTAHELRGGTNCSSQLGMAYGTATVHLLRWRCFRLVLSGSGTKPEYTIGALVALQRFH